MAYAVIRVRGNAQAGKKVSDTLAQLHLCKINHMVLLPENKSVLGMLRRVKDFITWGEISPEMIAKVLLKRGEPVGKTPGLSDEFVRENSSKHSSLFSFAKAIGNNESRLSEIDALQPVIRLHPPKSGYEGVKRSYRMGGSLGYRGKAIEHLLQRMIDDGKQA